MLHRSALRLARPVAHTRPFFSLQPVLATPRDPIDPQAASHSEQNPHLQHKPKGTPDVGAGAAAATPTLPSQAPHRDADYYARDDHALDDLPVNQKTFVVSHPEHRDTPYEVPSGAFPNSDPYSEYKRTDAPAPTTPSSTSSAAAHPNTTNRVPHTDEQYPYGSSSAVRHKAALGEHAKGADGGLGLQDGGSVKAGNGELASRNRWPDEEQGKLGNKEAWTTRR